MKKRILCVILSLAAVFSLVGFHATETWFGSGENKSMKLSSGDLDFSVEGDLKLKNEDALVLPGQELELAKAVVITNYSTIDTELRVSVECTYDGSTEVFKWIEFVNAENSNWEVGDDGYIYYAPGGNRRIPATEGKPTETTTVAETTTEAGTEVGETTETTTDGVAAVDYENPAENEIPLDGKIKISGDVPIDLQGKELNLEFVIEAKQADLVEWEHFTPAEEVANG
ncbi:MAG: hypothetical protein J6L89_04460 [Clostridia bacterium]|nr:hypothetical protein [Clostridia bacterium]